MKHKTFKWFMIVGYPTKAEDGQEKIPFICCIQSESPRNVLKYHGGKQRCEDMAGNMVTVQFPTKERHVQLLPNWQPENAFEPEANQIGVVRVIPVTKYRCECGEERFSEYPYRSMWCSCGQKAYPIQDEWNRPIPPFAHPARDPYQPGHPM